MNLVYYGLVAIIGTAAVAILVYSLAISGCLLANPSWLSLTPSNDSHLDRPTETISLEQKSFGFLRANSFLVSTFRYRKGIENSEESGGDGTAAASECVVCLCRFEDEEYVRQLPGCKHSFHVLCIDMWLYSHSNCPLCRAPIDRLTPDLNC